MKWLGFLAIGFFAVFVIGFAVVMIHDAKEVRKMRDEWEKK